MSTQTTDGRAKRRVLLIDDDADFLQSTAALLEASGYDVVTAPSERAGFEALRERRPDLIVTDVMMEHDGAGYELNQAVKYGREFEDQRDVPVLMVSSIEVDPATRFSTAGEVAMVTPNGYFTKPLDIPRFLAEVRDLAGA